MLDGLSPEEHSERFNHIMITRAFKDEPLYKAGSFFVTLFFVLACLSPQCEPYQVTMFLTQVVVILSAYKQHLFFHRFAANVNVDKYRDKYLTWTNLYFVSHGFQMFLIFVFVLPWLIFVNLFG